MNLIKLSDDQKLLAAVLGCFGAIIAMIVYIGFVVTVLFGPIAGWAAVVILTGFAVMQSLRAVFSGAPT